MEAIPRRMKKGKESYDGFIPKMTAEELVQSEDVGFCLSCGETQECEPDARKYECDSCGEETVYGIACSLLEMGLIEIGEDKTTDPLYQSIDGGMRAEMHRGFVGMQMFCACGVVLDCYKSVALDLYKEKAMIWSKIICLNCWEGPTGELIKEKVKEWWAFSLEVYNGKTGEVTRMPEEKDNSEEQTSFTNMEVGDGTRPD